MLTVKQASELVNFTPARIKQLLRENNWDFSREGNSGVIKLTNKTVRELIRHKGLFFDNPKVLTIATQKGGVGKTFLNTNIAVCAAARGMKVLIVDADPEACATNTLLTSDVDYRELLTMLEVFQHDVPFSKTVRPTKYDGLDIIPCKGKARRAEKITNTENPKYLIKNRIKELTDLYDLIIFDLPPSFTTLISAFYLASDLVIQPCEPTVYCEESIDLTISDIEEACQNFDCPMPNIKILLNLYRDSEIASRDTRHSLETHHKDRLLPFQIGKYQDVTNLINSGLSVLDVKSNATADILNLLNYIAPLNSTTTKNLN